MRRRCRLDLCLVLAVCALAAAGAEAHSVHCAPLTADPIEKALSSSSYKKSALANSIQSSDLLSVEARGSSIRPAMRGLGESTVEHLDFGRIGGVALVSREVDQYGHVRAVDFLSYNDPSARWDMKLNVKHGAILRITRRWGGG